MGSQEVHRHLVVRGAPFPLCWDDIRRDLMQSQNLYHPPTVTSPPTHSGSGGYVGAVIRSLHFSSSGGISRGLVGSLNSHPCLAVTRSPTLPRCQRKPSGEIGLLLPSNSNKAVSPFSCWSGVTGSLLKGKSRCLRL